MSDCGLGITPHRGRHTDVVGTRSALLSDHGSLVKLVFESGGLLWAHWAHLNH